MPNSLAQLQSQLDAVFGRRPQVAVAVVEDRLRQRRALARARRLAKAHNIDLVRDRDGYWVTHVDFDDGDDDPCQGSHFCVGGDEVLVAVEAYVAAIAKRAGA